MDVVDLSPYGMAALFINAAMKSVHNLDLLCETCMDFHVLDAMNYWHAEWRTAHARRLNDESVSLRPCAIGCCRAV